MQVGPDTRLTGQDAASSSACFVHEQAPINPALALERLQDGCRCAPKDASVQHQPARQAACVEAHQWVSCQTERGMAYAWH